MAAYGFTASVFHEENGMHAHDMQAVLRTADALDEVIIFRSTGPWSMRWIELKYPTKNFHVKGKSSDWGPQAGFVPYLGKYSKVGANEAAATKGTKANDDGLHHNFARKVQLILSRDELKIQATRTEEAPSRKAITLMEQLPASSDFKLVAKRSGDGKEFVFRAVLASSTGNYRIFVYPDGTTANDRKFAFLTPAPLEVMTSSEVGADNRPMTGDYDLMAVCPRWSDLNTRTTTTISKPGLNFSGKGLQPGQTFGPGRDLDGVLDMTTNTGAKSRVPGKTFQGLGPDKAGRNEHGDMGNITPRILRCINRLNIEMGSSGALRKVHHNAESHRNAIFGALVARDMIDKDDGFPMTAFHPKQLKSKSPWLSYDVVTLENMAEFKSYAEALHTAGFFVPRNWTWGMSIRDTHQNHIAWR